METAKVRQYVFGRERERCRCCRLRAAQSMHELVFKSAGGKVSKRNSVAVCGVLVGADSSCHTYLQNHSIAWNGGQLGAEGTLTFQPISKAAADWMRVAIGQTIESPPMVDMEEAS